MVVWRSESSLDARMPEKMELVRAPRESPALVLALASLENGKTVRAAATSVVQDGSPVAEACAEMGPVAIDMATLPHTSASPSDVRPVMSVGSHCSSDSYCPLL